MCFSACSLTSAALQIAAGFDAQGWIKQLRASAAVQQLAEPAEKAGDASVLDTPRSPLLDTKQQAAAAAATGAAPGGAAGVGTKAIPLYAADPSEAEVEAVKLWAEGMCIWRQEGHVCELDTCRLFPNPPKPHIDSGS